MNIPPPNYPVGFESTTLRSSFAGGPSTDPWSDYGLEGYGSSSYSDPNLQQAYQYRAWAYQQLQSGTLNPQDQQAIMIYLQQLDQWIQQYEMSNGGGTQSWDPNTGQMGDPGTMGGPQIPTPDYQDAPREGYAGQMVYEQGSSFTWTVNPNESRDVHLYQADATIEIPSNADSAKVEMTEDPNFPGKECALVTVTRRDGSTQKIYVHNLDRENAHLNIQAASPDQVDMSAVAAPYNDKITAGELGSVGTTDQLGDPPTRMEGGKRIYDGQSFNISPVPDGSNEETEVMAAGDVTITPNSNSEWYTVEYDPTTQDYTVKVYQDEAKTQLKESIKIDGELLDHLYFAGDQTRVDWGTMASAGDPHQVDTSLPGADKVGLSTGTGGPAAGQAVSPDYPVDTAADEISGNTATYNTSSDVDVHAYYDDNITEHDITAPGAVTLHGVSYSDTFEITNYSEGPPKTWTIKVYKDGDPTNTETFNITGGAATTVTLDVMDQSSIVNSDAYLGSVTIGGAGAGSVAAPQIITDLETLTGKSDAQLLSALKSAGFNYTTIDELNLAINKGEFPPSQVDEKLINFLYILDPDFAQKASAATSVIGELGGKDVLATATARLVELLSVLYPDQNILPTLPNPDPYTAWSFGMGNTAYTPDYVALKKTGEFSLLVQTNAPSSSSWEGATHD